MDRLRRQVRRVYWRLLWMQLLRQVTWTLFGTLLIALVAVVIPKLWPVGIAGGMWGAGWLCGAILLGLGLGGLWTFVSRPSELEAAMEIDLRYGLKERVSSAVTLSFADQQTAVGKALIDDASHRIDRIDVRERFRPERTWYPLLPLATAALVFLAAWLFQDATSEQAAASAANATEVNQQVRKSMQELKKRLAERKKKEPAVGLKEADELMAKFDKVVASLDKSDVDRKKALVKLNNLSKELGNQREQLASSEKTREQLKQLKDIQNGPADRIASALQNGDMQRAMDELRKLSDKLRNKELSTAEKEQLKNQLQQLGKAIEDSLGARQELAHKQRELREKIDELKKKGDQAGAGQLQAKLDQLQQQLDALDSQNPQLSRLQQLATQLKDSAQSLENGDGPKTAQAFDQLAQDLQQLQEQMENLKSLDEMMTEIADAKSAINCTKCGGEGCATCQGAAAAMGESNADTFSDVPGRGIGAGHGMGERPEEVTETGGYRARVAADARQGEAVRMGDAQGPNVAGNTLETVKKEIASSFSEDPDPLTQQTLPRREREQTKEYFELLRQGQ